MNNSLARDFNGVSLLKFAIPNILSLMFISMYQMVDGVFIAKYVGENALAAINIVYPVPSIVLAMSLMLAVGGSAVVAKNMGEGKDREAKENLTMITITGLVLGIIFTVITFIFIDPILRFLGATELLYMDCYNYLYVLTLLMPMAVLQLIFQSFFIAAGRPKIGFMITLLAGITNILFDYIFVAHLNWGVTGAAIATSMGYSVSGLVGFIYFSINRRGTLYFVKPKARLAVLFHACLNGSSEMVSNLAASVTTLLFNKIMLVYLGEAGVSAITVVLYAQFLLTSVVMGFIGGISPILSYNYGNKDYTKINKFFRVSLLISLFFSIITVIVSFVFTTPIISVFIDKSSYVFDITYHGFRLFSISYLFAGFNIFVSGLFTALLNGKASAVISLLRTFVFLVISLIGLPVLIGVNGIWLAVPLAEFLSVMVSVKLLLKYRHDYSFTLGSVSQEKRKDN